MWELVKLLILGFVSLSFSLLYDSMLKWGARKPFLQTGFCHGCLWSEAAWLFVDSFNGISKHIVCQSNLGFNDHHSLFVNNLYLESTL